MLNIYTSEHIPQGYRLIQDVESKYSNMLHANIDLFCTDIFIKTVYKEIDKADLDGHYLITPFGLGTMYDCSTGAKAVIVAYLNRDKKNILVNISECGRNAIEIMVNSKYDFNTYLSTNIMIGASEKLVRLNGTELTLRRAARKVLYERIKGYERNIQQS